MSQRCTYQRVIISVLVFHFCVILVWVLMIHYVDIFGPISDPSHLTSSQATSKQSPLTISIPSNELHTIYSVGCDHLMYWMLQQSVTLDYSWSEVKQPGHLTRIVSGCNFATKHIREMSKSSIQIKPDIHFLDDKDLVDECLSNIGNSTGSAIFPLEWSTDRRFHILFMPSYDDIKQRHSQIFNGSIIHHYPQLNRIVALYILYHCTDYSQIPMDYLMMLDPDFVFLKAFTFDEMQSRFRLSLHHPVAGNYGLGDRWVKWLQEKGENINVDKSDSREYYEAGYILHHEDWFNLIPEWISWASFSYDHYDGIESDMYAYMIASYRLGLQHSLSGDFQSTCMKSDDQKIHPFDDRNYFIHYCSANRIDINGIPNLKEEWKLEDGKYAFNKHWTKARKDSRTKKQQLWMIECASPVLIEPPMITKLEKYDENGDDDYRKAYKQYQVTRRVVPLFNAALIDFKGRHCENRSMINSAKRIVMHEAHRGNGDLLYHIVDGW